MNIDFPSGVSKQTRLHRLSALPFSGGREVSPLHIVDWLVSGVRVLSVQPVLWLSVLLACADFSTLLGFVPLLRPVAVLLGPLVGGGLMLGQDAATRGQRVC